MTDSAPLPSLLDWVCFWSVVMVTGGLWSYAAWRRDEEQHRRDAQVLADAIKAQRAEDETRKVKR